MNQSIAAAFLAFIIGMPCGSYNDMIRLLRQNRGELVAGGGVTSAGDLLIRLTNPVTREWTILKRYAEPPQWTCILAAGQDWETFKQTPNCGEVEC